MGNIWEARFHTEVWVDEVCEEVWEGKGRHTTGEVCWGPFCFVSAAVTSLPEHTVGAMYVWEPLRVCVCVCPLSVSLPAKALLGEGGGLRPIHGVPSGIRPKNPPI